MAGLRAVEQLLAGDAGRVRRLHAEYRTANPRVAAVIARAREAGVEVRSANRARLAQMAGDARHQGVVAEVVRDTRLDEAGLRDLVEAALTAGEAPLLLLLDGLQDPHNLGACLRTAEAAGVAAVIVPRHGAAGITPAVSKVAAGAAESLPFATVANPARVLDWLGDYGVRRVGTSGEAKADLWSANLAGPLLLAMGREETGLSAAVLARCDDLVRLPMAGAVESLNVSVAAGICLFEALRQRSAGASQPLAGGPESG